MQEHVMNNQERITCKEHIRTIKNIQIYSMKLSCFNIRFSNINKQLGKEIILSCKIHMVEEETLDGGPKGEGKEKLREGE